MEQNEVFYTAATVFCDLTGRLERKLILCVVVGNKLGVIDVIVFRFVGIVRTSVGRHAKFIASLLTNK